MTRFHWPFLDASQKLSAEEATELAARVAELTKAGLPLGAGLRAAADELPGRRLRRVLRNLADRLDAGMDLATALDPRLPPDLRGLVLAGLRSGQLTEVLEQYVDLRRSQSELRHRLVLRLSYPLLLLAMLVGVSVLGRFGVEMFAKVLKDFRTTLPALTTLFINGSGVLMWGFVILLAAMIVIPILLAVAPGVRWLWPLLNRVPMIGPLLRWSHLAQFSRLMSLLLEQRVPLPDALRLCGEGLSDSDLAFGCSRVADEVESGRVLYESMAARRQFPASLIPVVEWGQRAPALPEAFRAATEMFEGRVQSQGSLLEAVLLPIMFLLIVGYVGLFIMAMFLPFLSLITMLSGAG